MKKELLDLRMPAVNKELNEVDLPNEPFQLFDIWFQEAIKNSSHPQPNAMNLSTNGTNGFPQARIVLLKDYSEKGFVFFTNYKSQKGIGIAFDNKVSLNFYWPDMERTVRIEGLAQKATEKESDDYFHSRPLESRYNAIVSHQSEKIKNRTTLFTAIERLKKELNETDPKRPAYWGGYIVTPVSIEFWQGREFRLHDRIIYRKTNDYWAMSRLSP